MPEVLCSRRRLLATSALYSGSTNRADVVLMPPTLSPGLHQIAHLGRRLDFCVVLASEFYDELRGIEAELVGNVTVVSCHRDARLPADTADLS